MDEDDQLLVQAQVPKVVCQVLHKVLIEGVKIGTLVYVLRPLNLS